MLVDFSRLTGTVTSVRVNSAVRPHRIAAFDLIRTITGAANPRRVFRDIGERHQQFRLDEGCTESVQPSTELESTSSSGSDGDDEDFAFRAAKRVVMHQFPGTGQRPTPTVDLRGAVELIFLLPGNRASEFRSNAARLLIRHLAGDESLVDEVRSQALCDSDEAKLAREHLAATAEENSVQAYVSPDAERLRVDALRLDVAKKMQETACAAIPAGLTGPAAHAALLIRDYALNWIMNELGTGQGAAARLEGGGGGEGARRQTEPITVSQIAARLGKRPTNGQLATIGKAVKKRYIARHGRSPAKKPQFVDGAMRDVRSYEAADEDLIREEIRRRVL